VSLLFIGVLIYLDIYYFIVKENPSDATSKKKSKSLKSSVNLQFAAHKVRQLPFLIKLTYFAAAS
jgi:hypothetical protein